MRKALLFLIVMGFAGSLLAADPIVGTWKLNINKSKPAPGQPVGVKDLTVITREVGSDLETVFQGTAANGSAFSIKFICPQQGGLMKSEQPATEGSLIVITVVKPGEMYGTSLQNGKQVELTHSLVSADGKTLNRSSKAIDSQGKTTESLMVFDRQ